MLASFSAPTLPTPVRQLARLGTVGGELWLKNDGLSHATYGGNKVRKAARLLLEAERRNASRILTFGAVGSHHVLTLTLFARAAAKRIGAVLMPQPHSDHAARTLRASLYAGLEPYALSQPIQAPLVLLRAYRAGDYVVPPGGSNLLGASAYADAVDELAVQIDAGLLPMPDWIVAPLGSGGTVAGLAAGVARRGLSSRVLAVQVVAGSGPRLAVRWLLRRLEASLGPTARAHEALSRIVFDAEQVGRGYGFATPAGERAAELARAEGLLLEPTYTAKAFAAALELLAQPERHGSSRGRPIRVLYWHTFAATPIEPLLEGAPPIETLPNELLALLR